MLVIGASDQLCDYLSVTKQFQVIWVNKLCESTTCLCKHNGNKTNPCAYFRAYTPWKIVNYAATWEII